MVADERGQRLMGATLLVFANKTDVDGCMSKDEIRQVRLARWRGPIAVTLPSTFPL